MSTPPSRPHHLPKAPPPNTITLGVAYYQRMNFRGIQPFRPWYLLISLVSKSAACSPTPQQWVTYTPLQLCSPMILNPGCCHYLKLFHLWQCITSALFFQNIHSFFLLTKTTSDIAAPGSQAFTRGLNPNTGFPASPACRRQITGLPGLHICMSPFL